MTVVAPIAGHGFEITVVGEPPMLRIKSDGGKIYLTDDKVARLCEVLPLIFPQHFEKSA